MGIANGWIFPTPTCSTLNLCLLNCICTAPIRLALAHRRPIQSLSLFQLLSILWSLIDHSLRLPILPVVHRAAVSACRSRVVGTTTASSQPHCRPANIVVRTMANLPFGLDKILGEPDNLIPTDRERKSKKGYIPEFAPDDLKKEMEALGIDGIEELDELEEKNMEGYNNLGLVPPEGAGTFASPILIPSRMDNRVVGYSDPTTHAMFWFTIHNDDNTYYIKDLGLFFKMLHIPDEDAAHAHH